MHTYTQQNILQVQELTDPYIHTYIHTTEHLASARAHRSRHTYIHTYTQQDILQAQELTDPDALKDVTDEDLKEMNIGTIGARRKILAGIRKLNESKIVIVDSGKTEHVARSDNSGVCADLQQVGACCEDRKLLVNL